MCCRKSVLQSRFSLSKRQVEGVLALTLRMLMAMEGGKLREEEQQLQGHIAQLQVRGRGEGVTAAVVVGAGLGAAVSAAVAAAAARDVAAAAFVVACTFAVAVVPRPFRGNQECCSTDLNKKHGKPS
jgi:hypothetical protein